MRHAKSFQNHPARFGYRGVYTCGKILRTAGTRRGDKKFVVGFSCADFSDPNKGAALLLGSRLRDLARQTEIMLLAFGGGKLPAAEGKFEVVELGSIQSPRLQSIFYSACDTFAVPSRIESFGLTALEAMACGTPVVAFRTGGLAELVVHEKTGLLVDLATWRFKPVRSFVLDDPSSR